MKLLLFILSVLIVSFFGDKALLVYLALAAYVVALVALRFVNEQEAIEKAILAEIQEGPIEG